MKNKFRTVLYLSLLFFIVACDQDTSLKIVNFAPDNAYEVDNCPMPFDFEQKGYMPSNLKRAGGVWNVAETALESSIPSGGISRLEFTYEFESDGFLEIFYTTDNNLDLTIYNGIERNPLSADEYYLDYDKLMIPVLKGKRFITIELRNNQDKTSTVEIYGLNFKKFIYYRQEILGLSFTGIVEKYQYSPFIEKEEVQADGKVGTVFYADLGIRNEYGYSFSVLETVKYFPKGGKITFNHNYSLENSYYYFEINGRHKSFNNSPSFFNSDGWKTETFYVKPGMNIFRWNSYHSEGSGSDFLLIDNIEYEFFDELLD